MSNTLRERFEKETGLKARQLDGAVTYFEGHENHNEYVFTEEYVEWLESELESLNNRRAGMGDELKTGEKECVHMLGFRETPANVVLPLFSDYEDWENSDLIDSYWMGSREYKFEWSEFCPRCGVRINSLKRGEEVEG